MPLMSDGKLLKKKGWYFEIKDIFHQFPDLEHRSNTFRNLPSRVIQSTENFFFVSQREYACFGIRNKKFKIAGSDDCTTCQMLFLKAKDYPVVAVGHFDGIGVEKGVSNMISTMMQDGSLKNRQESNIRISAYIIGGFADNSGYSSKIFNELMDTLVSSPVFIDLQIICACEMNTRIRDNQPYPIIYGAAIAIDSGDICPASFKFKGPETSVRHASNYFTGENMMPAHDQEYNCLVVAPFDGKINTSYIMNVLNKDDKYLLEHFSTSPHCEPPDFIETLKHTFTWFLKYQSPLQQYFNGEAKFVHADDDGTWLK